MVQNIRFKAMVDPKYHSPQAVKNNGLVEGFYYEKKNDKGDKEHYIIDSETNTYWNILPETLSVENIDPYMVCNRENINFTLIDPSDDRWDDFHKQRMENGFDESETWSLDSTIAKFIYPRLKLFREIDAGYPAIFKNRDQWNDILDKMLFAFEKLSSGENIFEDDINNKINEGLDLFRENYHRLWW